MVDLYPNHSESGHFPPMLEIPWLPWLKIHNRLSTAPPPETDWKPGKYQYNIIYIYKILKCTYNIIYIYMYLAISGWWCNNHLENMSSSMGRIIAHIMENKQCSKPPTRYIYIYLYLYTHYRHESCHFGSSPFSDPSIIFGTPSSPGSKATFPVFRAWWWDVTVYRCHGSPR